MNAFQAAAGSLIADPNMSEIVQVTPVNGDARDIRAIWLDTEAGGTIVQEEPGVLAQASDVTDIATGAQVRVGGVNYVVRSRESDGRAIVRLNVERL